MLRSFNMGEGQRDLDCETWQKHLDKNIEQKILS